MKRTIKFRGKSLLSGQWLFGSHFTDGGEDYIIPQNLLGINDYEDYQVDQNTIGQFTSLYDKNNKCIFEGDILKVGDAFGEELLEVRFVRGVFAFLFNGDLDNEFPTCSPTHEWAEVVGNIYDNPELIKL